MPDPTHIGWALMRAREHANLTQVELAELANVHRNTICYAEQQKRSLRGDVLRRLAKALGVVFYVSGDGWGWLHG